MKGANNTYTGNIREGIVSTWRGLVLTFRHLWDARRHRKPINVEQKEYFEQSTGIVTLEYPHEAIPVPDHGRYRLHNEIDDCIVCDLCAKICPVNCIEIEPVKATEEIGKTSDGSSKRIYAGTFNIDMAKCCYCGLCTTVCPTECLTMTKTYDFSEFDVRNMVYHFSDMTPEQVEEKKKAYEVQQAEKAAAKKAATEAPGTEVKPAAPKPAFKPAAPKIAGVKPAEPKPVEEKKDEPAIPTTSAPQASAEAPKPVAKPVFKPKIPGVKPATPAVPPAEDKAEDNAVSASDSPLSTGGESEVPKPAAKPVFKPKIPLPKKPSGDTNPPPAES